MTGFRATYRLQLGGGFGFAAARELVPYLADLGVSHLYLSPSFQARRARRTATTWWTRRDLRGARRRGGVPRAGRARRARRGSA